MIVGGGSAGCVIANRLSANPAFRVMLIEAGPDFEPGAEPDAVRDRGVRTLMLRNFFWSDLMISDGGRPLQFSQAKLMGGGSSINGMHAQRGTQRDYDEWRQMGVEGWGWGDVLPYFKQLENDVDIDNEMHSKNGPVQVRRVPEEKWSGLTLALRDALDKRGLPRIDDANAGGADGTMPVPLSNTAADRASAASSYLTKEVRARPNLRIMSQTKVIRIVFDGKRVSCVELESGERIEADNVFVCAGALHSPALLLRSGLGPAAELAEAGIEVVADRPGIGRHLLNHPILSITSHLKRSGRQLDRRLRPPVPMIARYSSGVVGCQSTDMQLNLWERTPGPLEHDPMGRQLSFLMILLQKPYSQGDVRLDPANPTGPLRLRANILGDRRDLDRMVAGFKMCAEILLTEPVKSLVHSSFMSNLAMGVKPSYLTMKLLQDTLEARLISIFGALAVDYVPGMRARTMAQAGLDIRNMLAEPEEALVDMVKRFTGVGGHPSGTCRMGAIDQRESVVDSRGRVIGVEGLRVVDASIFPSMMNAGTNLPVLMAAEKIADMTIQDRRAGLRAAEAAARLDTCYRDERCRGRMIPSKSSLDSGNCSSGLKRES
ncbi:GMC family oxidoreductase N-terminal domain-containing protein [Bradyrhizobium sp. 200]|nr:GMC family oxidoreductase N-terminal domain-containing protein [Bradyrhizobium sp. 200]